MNLIQVKALLIEEYKLNLKRARNETSNSNMEYYRGKYQAYNHMHTVLFGQEIIESELK